MFHHFIGLALKGLKNTTKNLSQNNEIHSPDLQHRKTDEAIKVTKSPKNDQSTGYDNISLCFMKPVAEYITSPS